MKRIAAAAIGAAVLGALAPTLPAAADDGPTVTVGPATTLLTGGQVDAVWTTYWRRTPVTVTRRVRHRITARHVILRRIRRGLEHPRYRVTTVTRTVDRNQLYGMTSNRGVYVYEYPHPGDIPSNPTTVLTHGGPGSPDECGIHPAGSLYKATPTMWVTFYHAEQAAPGEGCATNRTAKHTRWTIRRMVSYNAGATWHKGGAVVSQDSDQLYNADGSWNYGHDDAGEAHLTVRGGWMYLTYDASPNTSTGRRESIARAPVASLGVAGSWSKWYDGAWSEPGLGGHQTPLAGIPAGTRGISWNTYLHEWLAVSVHVSGAVLYTSPNLIDWQPYTSVFATRYTHGAWSEVDGTAYPAYGYGSIIGDNGSPVSSGQSFYLYYMEKPPGVPFRDRLLRRRVVTLH